MKRIPHIVKIYTEIEGGPLFVKASQPAGTTKETLIKADQDYRKQLLQRAQGAKTAVAAKSAAKAKAAASPPSASGDLESPITPALVKCSDAARASELVALPSTAGPWRSGFVFPAETPCVPEEVPKRSKGVSVDLKASPTAQGPAKIK